MRNLTKTAKKNIQLKPIETKREKTFKDYWNEIIKALIATK
ncbi:hypothetical protein P4J24_13915 [Bacillus anthracis]|nr:MULTISPECIES: hypothetical protein [Bacillus cereus group]MEB9682998.1 hypothetical protein [Bacillus anthracis]